MIKKKILMCLGAVALTLSLAGCSLIPSKGNEGNALAQLTSADPAKETAATEVESEKETEAEPETEIENGETENKSAFQYKNLEEFFNNPLNKGALDAMSDGSAYENIFSDVEVTVEGNRMIYKFTSKNELGSNVEETMQANANVDVSGGTERLKYFVSVGYFMQNGLVRNFGSANADVNS